MPRLVEIGPMVLKKRVFTFFVLLSGVFRPTREFFTHLETSTLPVANFDLCSALTAIEH